MSTRLETPNGLLMNSERWRSLLSDAAKEVFSMMLGAELAVPEQVDLPNTGEVTAMVGLAGALCGILSVRCSAPMATQMAALMLALEGQEAELHSSDAVGEVCNMVAGNFKAKDKDLEDKCMLSVPTVITGDNYTMHSLIVGSRIEVPLLFQNQLVWFALDVRG